MGLSAQHDFDIPAQPLAAALVEYSRLSGVQVLLRSSTAARFRSRPAKGRMSGGEALSVILKGTGYSVRYISSRSVSLVIGEDPVDRAVMRLDPLIVTAEPVRIGDGQPYARYAEGVLAELRRSLQRHEFTSRDHFTITVRVWLDHGGRVERTELDESTGDAKLDALVLRRLAGVTVSVPPPERLPQPLRFKLWS